MKTKNADILCRLLALLLLSVAVFMCDIPWVKLTLAAAVLLLAAKNGNKQ